MRLDGKVAFITGGTSGIGKATVKRLRAEGAHVLFTGRKEEAGAQVAEAFGATFIKHDVTDLAGYAEISKKITADYGRLDIAFANAGTEAGDSDVENITPEGWNQVIDINLTGVFHTVQAAIELMKQNPGGASGSIILNSSMTSQYALGNYFAYTVCKGAHESMVRSAAVYLCSQGYNIRINSIHPGVIETELITAAIDSAPDPAAARAHLNGLSAMNRLGTVDEIAGLVAYLSSDEAAFASGSSFSMDGASRAGAMGV